jgi:curved DNA-binding protein CbpA
LGTKSQNHYEILGLWRDAGEAEIRRAYRRLALLNHPDVSSDPAAAERFRAIQNAYDILSDPASRTRFDATLGAGVRPDADRPRSDRGAGIPEGWTPPWAQDWNAEAWLRANAGPAPRSARAIGAELRRSWKTLAGYLSALVLIIAVCALLDRAIPGLGTVVVATTFTLPFFAYFFLVFSGLRDPEDAFRNRRRRNRARVDWTADTERGHEPR